MLGPIRRSVSQPLLRSLGRRACIRQIHARDVVRGPVAAEARVESELFVTDFSIQQTPKNSASKRKLPSVPTQVPQQSKPSPQQKQKNSPQKKKETKKPIQKTERIEVEEPEISDEVKRSTSSSIDSPVNWKKETIFKLYEPPTTEQLPDTLHSKTSIPQSLISWRENPLQYLREGLRFTLNFSAVLLKSKTIRGGNNSKAKQSAQMHRVKLMVKWGRQVSVAIGDGTTKDQAARNAAWHFLLRDYASPILQYALIYALFKNFPQEIVNTNKSAKVDVYDYAAQFDVVPTFKNIAIPAMNGGKPYHFCRITVEGTDIVGEGFHKSLPLWAEIGACVNFKEKAEQSHQGDKLLVKDINTLTSQTGKKFLEYCKIRHKDWAEYKFMHKSVGGDEVLGQLFLGDKLVSECRMPNKVDAEAICYYLAARDMKAQSSKLWDDFVVYMHEHAGEILHPIQPLGVWMNPEAIGALRNRIPQLLELERELEAFSRIQQSLSDEVDAELETQFIPPQNPHMPEDQVKSKSEALLRRLQRYESNPTMESMRTARAGLPLTLHAKDCRKLFDNSDVCVLVGSTGSGKTTQVPQIILDQYIREGRGAECNIICTQPRRIAATSVARRVAAERGERLGQSIGYHVRFGNNSPQWGGSINYCTTGILLRQLQGGWDRLKGVTHVIVDEVHERSVEIDLLMVLLKRVLEARRRGEDVPPIKVILMSATIDTTLFRLYFGSWFEDGECPYIQIPGSLFPVEKYYLDDVLVMLKQYPGLKDEMFRDENTSKYLKKESEARKYVADVNEDEEGDIRIDWSRTGSAWEEERLSFKEDAADQPDLMIANIIAHLCQKKGDGAVLVFLPGINEIVSLNDMMKSRTFYGVNFSDESQYRIFMLHSSIPTMQQEVFNPLPGGIRKIILSTNIAETSVTIPEVAFVVDSCRHREKRYSQTRRSTALVNTWISSSSARQRAGRAGRVKSGEYYALIHAERFNALPAGDTPEIKRVDLQDVCLDVRTYGMSEPIGDILKQCIEPPSSYAVDSALRALKKLGALDQNESLTPFGHILAQLPVSPALGKMVLLGAVFKCLDPILILAAIESSRNFFLAPPDQQLRNKSIRRSFSLGHPSDHFALLNGYREWRFIKATRGRDAANEFAYGHLMHVGGLYTIEKTSEQMMEMLVDLGLVRGVPPEHRYNFELGNPELNINVDVHPLIYALFVAGIMPNLAVQKGPVLLQTNTDGKALIHPSSINNNRGQPSDPDEKRSFLGAGPPGTLVMFSSKAETSGGVFLRDTTVLGPVTSLMFSGKLTRHEESSNVLYADDWIPFRFERGAAPLMLELTSCIERFLQRTWTRLKVLTARGKDKSYGDGVSFYDEDPSREAIVRAVVEALERADSLERLRRKMESGEIRRRQT